MAGKTGTLVAVLAGAAIGAGLGILFAPDQGANTRRKIKEGYGTKKDELKEKITELTEQLKNKIGSSKADLESQFDHLVANVESEKDDIINTLERKLEQLKNTRFAGSGKSQENTDQKGFGSEGASSI